MDEHEAARMFHDTYETLAPSFGYETRPDTREFDPESPNGKLMVAVCRVMQRYDWMNTDESLHTQLQESQEQARVLREAVGKYCSNECGWALGSACGDCPLYPYRKEA